MKKHFLTIIVTAICLIAVGVSLFLLLRSQEDNIYCESFTLKTRQVTIGVGDKLSFSNTLYNISPANCQVLPKISSADAGLVVTDDYVTSYTTGSYNIVFSIAVSKEETIFDTMKITVVNSPDYAVDFTKNEIDIYLGEDTSCNCLDLFAIKNTTFYSNPIVSYTNDGVCELDLDNMMFKPIGLGSTSIKVSLTSTYGLTVSDEITVNVLPMPEKYFSLPTIADEVQVVNKNTAIELEYYIKQGNEDMDDQRVTLALYNYDSLVVEYLNVINDYAPYIVFKITETGSYTLRITSVADTSVSVSIRFEVQ